MAAQMSFGIWSIVVARSVANCKVVMTPRASNKLLCHAAISHLTLALLDSSLGVARCLVHQPIVVARSVKSNSPECRNRRRSRCLGRCHRTWRTWSRTRRPGDTSRSTCGSSGRETDLGRSKTKAEVLCQKLKWNNDFAKEELLRTHELLTE